MSAVGDIEWRLVAEFKSFCSMHERLHSAEVEIHFSTSSIQYFHLFLFIIRSYSSLRFHFLFASNSLPVYASLQFQHIFSLPILFFIFCSFYSTAHFFFVVLLLFVQWVLWHFLLSLVVVARATTDAFVDGHALFSSVCAIFIILFLLYDSAQRWLSSFAF